jgi:dihydrofolate reductase
MMINNTQHNKTDSRNKMKISLIVAMANNRVIGINGQMPWHLSADLKKFRQITTGHPILMGRKTYQSIGRPLPGRRNIVISRNQNYQIDGCDVFNDIENAINSCQESEELFVIGGAAFYETMLPKADFLYLTEIKKEFVGDTYFPEINYQEWQEIERLDINDDTSVDFCYSFLKLQKIIQHEKN